MAKERTVVAEGPLFKRYSDNTFLIKKSRWSHPHVVVKGKDGINKKTKEIIKGRFGIIAMMPKATHRPVYKALDAMINEMLAEAKIAKVKPENKFLRDGELSDKPEYEGHWTVSANEDRSVKVRDVDGKTRITADTTGWEDKIYGGCIGSVLIRPWVQNSVEYGKRVNCGLVSVQWTAHGEPFGAGNVSDDDLDETYDNEASDADWDDDDDI